MSVGCASPEPLRLEDRAKRLNSARVEDGNMKRRLLEAEARETSRCGGSGREGCAGNKCQVSEMAVNPEIVPQLQDARSSALRDIPTFFGWMPAPCCFSSRSTADFGTASSSPFGH